MLHDARSQAMSQAAAQGWKRVSVTAIKKVGPQTYEVSVVLTS
jgi:hypothetical protein